jgi:hypothetical protein
VTDVRFTDGLPLRHGDLHARTCCDHGHRGGVDATLIIGAVRSTSFFLGSTASLAMGSNQGAPSQDRASPEAARFRAPSAATSRFSVDRVWRPTRSEDRRPHPRTGRERRPEPCGSSSSSLCRHQGR